MSEFVDFKIRGKLDGREITPESINFTRFNEFNQQVEKFMIGTDAAVGDKLQLDTVLVQVVPGSYCLRLVMSIAMLALVESKLRILERSNSLSMLDKNRADVVEKWQSKAKRHDELFYEIQVVRSDGSQAPSIRIGHDTDFRRSEVESWAPIETYLLGEILDAGGQNPNVHIRLLDSGEIHIVQSDRQTIASLERNPIYKRALLHVEGEQEIGSGRMQKLRLKEFVNYNPDYDQAALDEFVAEGRKAWADVPDAATWVRELRGG